MKFMFCGCSSLNKLNLNNFDFNNVIHIEGIFSLCKSLKELDLNDFNTNNVTNMIHMFVRCSYKLIMKIKTQYKNIKEEVFY